MDIEQAHDLMERPVISRSPYTRVICIATCVIVLLLFTVEYELITTVKHIFPYAWGI